MFPSFPILLALAFFSLQTNNVYSANSKDALPSALVVEVGGKGSAKIKRKTGMEVFAAKNTEVGVGDRVITDSNTMVDLMLVDGSVLRVGLNSDFKLESVEKKKGLFSWAFGLLKGGVRAIVEKSPKNADSKLKINTPVGTVGIRGTEFLLVHDPDGAGGKGTTEVYGFSGRVLFGPLGCVEGRNCVEILKDSQSAISAGERVAAAARAWHLRDIIYSARTGTTTQGALNAMRAQILLGANDYKKLETQLGTGMSEEDLRRVIAERGREFQDQQDRLLNRTAQQREAYYKAILDGTLSYYMRLADKIALKGKEFKPDGDLNTGLVNMRRFEVGEAIAKADVRTGETIARFQETEQRRRASGKNPGAAPSQEDPEAMARFEVAINKTMDDATAARLRKNAELNLAIGQLAKMETSLMQSAGGADPTCCASCMTCQMTDPTLASITAASAGAWGVADPIMNGQMTDIPNREAGVSSSGDCYTDQEVCENVRPANCRHHHHHRCPEERQCKMVRVRTSCAAQ